MSSNLTPIGLNNLMIAAEEPEVGGQVVVVNDLAIPLRSQDSDSSQVVISEKEAVFTFPIPYDEDGDNLTLFVDISEDGRFDFELSDSDNNQYLDTTGFYRRISMGNPADRAKMKIFSNGQFISVPNQGVNLPYYGETCVFVLDNEMVPGYKPGKTYFGRYRWMGRRGDTPDWTGFIFTYDFHDIRPPKLENDFSIYPCYIASVPDTTNKTVTVQKINPISASESELVGNQVTAMYDYYVSGFTSNISTPSQGDRGLLISNKYFIKMN